MTLFDYAVEAAASKVYQAAWGQITPEEAAKQIIASLNPTIWPRCTPGYGTTGTLRRRKASS